MPDEPAVAPAAASVVTTPSTEPDPARVRSPQRLASLDVIRGLALCGILFANVGTIMGVMVVWRNGQPPMSYTLQHLLVQERFFPVFSALFGVGFGMIWQSALRRGAGPRVVLLRRLSVLVVLGVLHQLLQPGEALLEYGMFGLIVLLPATFLPAKVRPVVCLAAGIVLTGGGLLAGGIALIPGLFLLGFAAAEAEMPRRIEESARPGAVLAGLGLLLAIPGTILQLRDLSSAGFAPSSAVAGLGIAMVIVGLVVMAMRTRARRALEATFAPLGRMALTNYVGASVVGALLALPLFSPAVLQRGSVAITEPTMYLVWAGCVVLLVVQSVISRLWLTRFGQGPLEKLWRWATWAGVRTSVSPAAD